MLKSMLSSARERKLPVCATDVDTEPDAQALLKLGCSFGRGQLFGLPMNAAEAQRFIAMNWKTGPALGKTA